MPIELTYRRFARMMDRRESQLICPAGALREFLSSHAR
jgi:hypothetical protein